jgi:hypothetical protein
VTAVHAASWEDWALDDGIERTRIKLAPDPDFASSAVGRDHRAG